MTSQASADSARQRELLALAQKLGHRYADLELLERAMCHASTGNERRPNYERLEFLGDAVLNFLVAESLFRDREGDPVGQLTELRARLVARQPLARIARNLELGVRLEGGRGLREEDRRSPRILADLVEAVLGSVYLDGGIEAARQFVARHVLPLLAEVERAPQPQRDAKSRLLHLAQSSGRGQPAYRVLQEDGPPHDRTFEVGVYLSDELLASAHGKSRQAAEKRAAAQALEQLAHDADRDPPPHS